MNTLGTTFNIVRFFSKFSQNWNNYSTNKKLVVDTEFSIYDEEYFHHTKQHEQKRSYRSKSNFLLVLLDISILSQFVKRKDLSKRIKKALSIASRDVDIKGWYKKHEVIGIIYTDYNAKFNDCILLKINDSFLAEFGSQLHKTISIKHDIFPKEPDTVETLNTQSDFLFYKINDKNVSDKPEFRYAYSELVK